MHGCRRFGIPSLSISGLVVFVIILPACCTAIYHYVSYKKGWDDEDPECDSACSECNVQMGQESEEEIQFRFVLYTTVCPKVPWKSNVPLFSAICGQILKPFGLLIATKVRFVMVYDKA